MKMKKYSQLVLFQIVCLLTSFSIIAQTPNIGVRLYDENVSNGFTLFTPEQNNNVYLINNCGEKVNEWAFNELPGSTCYFLENGNLLRAGKDSIEIRDWDNTIIWTFSMLSIGLNQHHDIEPLPNGNVLCLITDNYSDSEMIAQGRDPSAIGTNFKLDKIIELQPVGLNNANIVWEWKFMDHFIQDIDATKPNFGIVINHPELIDLNYVDANITVQNIDYTHVNGIDYNSDLDQIIMSARHLNELYIIDHSTTTIEAAGHTGGNSNLGGDILWRWGNPQVYKQGGTTDQRLFLQHDSKWVESGYLDQGKISVFNNGGDGTNSFSSIHLITPEIVNGIYIKENNTFKPSDFEWSWSGSLLGTTVLEGKKSGAHSLPNGNFILCESHFGQVSEITKSGNHLWTYRNPTGSGQTIFNQFNDFILGNSIFRAEKYPENFIGFTGKDVTPIGIIEDQNSISELCSNVLDNQELNFSEITIVNPVKDGIIRFNKSIILDEITLIDIHGKTIFTQRNFHSDSIQLDLESSIYFVRLQFENKTTFRKVIFQ